MSAADAHVLPPVLQYVTLSERLSASTLIMQRSPVHNTRALSSLKGIAAEKERQESLKVSRVILDWWIGRDALNRQLKYVFLSVMLYVGFGANGVV